MNPHTRDTNICGDSKERNPEIFYLSIRKHLLQEGIKPEPWHHTGVRIG